MIRGCVRGLILALAFGVAPGALAQRGLPEAVFTSLNLSADQRAQVEGWTDEIAAGLRSDAPVDRQRARQEALRVLDHPDVSVAVRLEIGRDLTDDLPGIIGGGDDHAVINALLVAGSLATPGSIDLLNAGRSDEREMVRLRAVAGLERTFQIIGTSAPTIDPRQLETLVRDLGEGLPKEPSVYVRDVYVRALTAAAEVNRAGTRADFAAIRPRAFAQLAAGLRALMITGVRQPADAIAEATLVRGLKALRDALSQRLAVAARTVDPIAPDAAMAAGNAVWYVLQRLDHREYPQAPSDASAAERDAVTEARAMAAQVLTVAQAVIYFAEQSAGGQARPLTIAQQFALGTREGDEAFRLEATEVLERLKNEPLRIPEDQIGGQGG